MGDKMHEGKVVLGTESAAFIATGFVAFIFSRLGCHKANTD